MSVPDVSEALSAIPQALRDSLFANYSSAMFEYRAGDWENLGLKAGKFCEIAYCICCGHATADYPSEASKPSNFQKACRDLENYNKSKGRAICIQVPRVLAALYELRNNRAIGHVGGDVDPNHMDAEFFIKGLKQVLAEFVRNFSELDLESSFAPVEKITVREFPVVWFSGDVRRVLLPSLTASEKVLVLLYSEGRQVCAGTLQKWVEYNNKTGFRRKVLRPLHKKAFVQFDSDTDKIEILPPGQKFVESSGLLEGSR